MRDKTYISFKVDGFDTIPQKTTLCAGLMIEDISNLAKEYHVDSDNAHYQLNAGRPELIQHGIINCVVKSKNYIDAAKKIVVKNTSGISKAPNYTFVTFECLESSETYGCMVEVLNGYLNILVTVKFTGEPHDIFHEVLAYKTTPAKFLNRAKVGNGIYTIPVRSWKSKYNK